MTENPQVQNDYNYCSFLYKPVVRIFGVIKWSQYFSIFDFVQFKTNQCPNMPKN